MRTKTGISYEINVKVYNNGKHVGDIKEVSGGFQYFPKGNKTGGEIKGSIALVQTTLESW